MDGGGRFARSLKTPARAGGQRQPASAPRLKNAAPMPRATAARRARDERAARSTISRLVDVVETRLPRGFGLWATGLVLAGSLSLGVIKGDHVTTIVEGARDVRDALANTAGFHIDEVTINGRKHLSQDDILAIAGVTVKRSLLFLDVSDTRDKLRGNPWIAEATVLKLYPNHLRIDLTENAPFALWQKDGRISVVADNGAVLEEKLPKHLANLPFFVGEGAARRGKDFLALVSRYPRIRQSVRAMVLVGERRWNLRLTNGIDVRLPEYDPERALQILDRLAQEKQLLTRDIVAIDLRLPDRVTVRLSDTVFEARQTALKAKRKPGDKAGDA